MFNSSLSMSEFVLHCAIKPEQRNITATLLILIYLVSLTGNLLVILIIIMNHQLQSPMYIYICTLAMIDLVNSTILIPKMVSAILFDSLVVAYAACLVQMYLILNLELMESLLLTSMAIDRYVAVVFPLRYPSIVTSKAVCIGVTLLAVTAFLINISCMMFVSELSFCETNILPYCFCDYSTMVHIACTEDPKYLLLLSTIVITTGVFPLALILFSYFIIALAALRTSSLEGKKKVFSTCLTHLLVVGLFYIPLMTSYILPGAGVKLSTEAYNAMVIVGNVVPPMMNPIIYSFRNKEIKSSIYKLFTGKRTSPKINNQ